MSALVTEIKQVEPRSMPEQIHRTLGLLFQTGDVTEVRALIKLAPAAVGYFNDWDLLATEVENYSGIAKGIYFTLNPVHPALLARAENQFIRGGKATSDDDVLCRRHLLIDIDPQRPANTNSTEQEHDAAIERARDIRYCLGEEGWPVPLLGDSGNGAHLIYRLPEAFPNNEQGRCLVKALLEEISNRFSGEGIEVDQTVHNASRISKLYGTGVIKGEVSEERPARWASIVDAPETLEPISAEIIEKFARYIVPENAWEPIPIRGGSTMQEFINRHSIKTRAAQNYRGGQKWHLDACPFNPEHRAPDSVLYELPSGAKAFKCSHNSCRAYNWRAFRTHVEGYKPRLQQTANTPETIGGLQKHVEAYPSSGYFEVNEDVLATEFVRHHGGELRYCHGWGWLRWDKTQWRYDETGMAFHWARLVCRNINTRQPKPKMSIAKAATAASVEKYAKSDPAIAITRDALDCDKLLLGTPGGVVDLRTGEIRPARINDYITKSAAVSPDEKASRVHFDKFLNEITQADEGMKRYLQRIAGYCLTGSTREESLYFIYGPGGNGKSKFVNTLASVMGDYAKSAQMDLLNLAYGDRHPVDLADLCGARLVTASETQEGRKWDVQRLKQLTGGDPITARFMRQDPFTYQPEFKLVIIGNYQPELGDIDDAIRRRFHVIPFRYKPPVPDLQLDEKLHSERPAILAWAIEGCLQWQREGQISKPEAVAEESKQYFSTQSGFDEWLYGNCQIAPEFESQSKHLYSAWKKWAEAYDHHPGSQKRFSGRLQKLGYRTRHGKNGTKYLGLKLKGQPEQERLAT
ncbi:MAG: phage/plasmid primase, P4 family [Bryobacteraceae bacterium]